MKITAQIYKELFKPRMETTKREGKYATFNLSSANTDMTQH